MRPRLCLDRLSRATLLRTGTLHPPNTEGRSGSCCGSNLAYTYATSGRRSEAVKILRDLENRSNNGFSSASEIALVYVGLDEKDQAMTWLEKAYEERFNNPSVLFRPCFDPLRSDPRFQYLLRRIGLNR